METIPISPPGLCKLIKSAPAANCFHANTRVRSVSPRARSVNKYSSRLAGLHELILAFGDQDELRLTMVFNAFRVERRHPESSACVRPTKNGVITAGRHGTRVHVRDRVRELKWSRSGAGHGTPLSGC